jgi:hypothetical protein
VECRLEMQMLQVRSLMGLACFINGSVCLCVRSHPVARTVACSHPCEGTQLGPLVAGSFGQFLPMLYRFHPVNYLLWSVQPIYCKGTFVINVPVHYNYNT